MFIPYIVDSLYTRIDSEYLGKVTEKLQKIKKQMDSPKYDYISEMGSSGNNPNHISRWPIFVFLFSAFFCLSCSAIFHLFYPMSGKAYQVFSRLDYAGINILIIGSSLPSVYYGHYCKFPLFTFYFSIITVCGTILFVWSLFSYLHKPENFVIKTLVYAAFSASCTLPLAHFLIDSLLFGENGDTFTFENSLPYYFVTLMLYGIGACFYTYRYP